MIIFIVGILEFHTKAVNYYLELLPSLWVTFSKSFWTKCFGFVLWALHVFSQLLSSRDICLLVSAHVSQDLSWMFPQVASFIPFNNRMRWVPSSSPYIRQVRKWSLHRSTKMPIDTQTPGVVPGFDHNQAVWMQSPGSQTVHWAPSLRLKTVSGVLETKKESPEKTYFNSWLLTIKVYTDIIDDSLRSHLHLSFSTKDNCRLVRTAPGISQNRQQLTVGSEEILCCQFQSIPQTITECQSAPGMVTEARDSKMQMRDPFQHVIYSRLPSLYPSGSPKDILESSWNLIIIITAYLFEASVLLKD